MQENEYHEFDETELGSMYTPLTEAGFSYDPTPLETTDWDAKLKEITQEVYVRDLGVMCHAIMCGCQTHKAQAQQIGEFWQSPVPDPTTAKVYLGLFEK